MKREATDRELRESWGQFKARVPGLSSVGMSSQQSKALLQVLRFLLQVFSLTCLRENGRGGGLSDEVIFFPVSLNCKCAALDRGEDRFPATLYGSSPPAPGRSIDPRLPLNNKDTVHQARLSFLKAGMSLLSLSSEISEPVSRFDLISILSKSHSILCYTAALLTKRNEHGRRRR